MGESIAAAVDIGSQFIGSAGSAVEGGLTAAGDALGNLGSSFGAGLSDVAGTGLETGLGTVGGTAGGGGGLADLVGSGTGLFGGTTGLEGTAIAGGAGGDLGSLISAGGTALDTAQSFLAAPAASGFNAGATTANPAAFGGASSTGTFPTSASLPSNVSNANAGASVFDTGTKPI